MRYILLERHPESIFPAAFSQHFHHLLHLSKLFHHPVDFADIHARPSGDAVFPGRIQKIRIPSLFIVIE